MAFKLVNGKLTFPAKTLGQNFEFGLDVSLATFTGNTFIGRGSTSSNYQVYPLDSDSIMGWRGTSTLSINLSMPVPLNTRTTIIFRRENDGIVKVYNSEEPAAASIGQISTTLSIQDFTRFGLASTRFFQGELFRMWFNIDGVFNEYYNADDPDATTMGDATVNEGTWVEYSDATEIAVSQLEQLTELQPVSIEQAGAADISMVTLEQLTELDQVAVTAIAIIAAVVLEQATELQEVSFEPGDPIFTSGILHDNTETPIINTTVAHATLYDITTGELVIRVVGAVTNSAGRVVIQSALLVADTEYDLNVETVDGQRIMPRDTAV